MAGFSSPLLKHVAQAGHRRFLAQGVVLMYHRIADPGHDPWRLCVSPDNFRRQMDVLNQAKVDVVPLGELLERGRGTGGRRRVAVTFDDGYRDNLFHAEPVLADHGFPATLFVTSGYVGSGRAFWWDQLAAILLSPGELPPLLELDGPVSGSWDLGDAAVYTAEQAARHRDWKPSRQAPTRRHTVMLELWKLLVEIDETKRQQAMRQICHWAGASDEGDALSRPMDREEILILATTGRWTIGAHGHTHSSLPAMDGDALEGEMHTSREVLRGISGQQVDCLSYPQGMYVDRIGDAARQAGFRFGCTSQAAAVTRSSSPLAIPRVTVPDVGAHDFAGKLAYFMAFER